jgi:hypothetical protein
MKRNLLCVLSLLSTLFALAACATPLTYSAKEIHGQIVDAETGQPIEGAVVVAQWVLSHIGSGHYGKRLYIHETVTDKNGNYVIPAWGPKPRPPLTELVYRDPQILIFKSGYEPEGLENSNLQTDGVRASEWDGRVIQLKKSGGQIEKQARYLGSFFTSLGYGTSNVDWRNYPRMLLAVYAEKRRLQTLGLEPGRVASVPDIEHFSKSDRDYLREFEK